MNHFVWDGSPAIFSIGDFELRWYSLMFGLSFYLSHKFMKAVFVEKGRGEDTLDPLLWYVALGTILGARLGHCLFYEPEYYLGNPLEILKVWRGGLASHGGAAGVLIAVMLYCRKYKESFIWLLDHLCIPVALSASFIRLGNFFNSEILGIRSDLPWAVIFKRVDSFPRHPAQLYESLFYFIIFLALLRVYTKYKAKLKQGSIFGLFLISVFSLRFMIEFVKLRQEAYESTFSLNTGQLLSIPFIATGIYLLFFKQSKSEKASIDPL